MSFQLTGYQGRDAVFQGSLRGDLTTLAADDVVKVRVGTHGDPPLLEFASDAPAAGGSTVQIYSLGSATSAAQYDILLRGADAAALPAGILDMEVVVVAAAGGETVVERGCLAVLETMGAAG